MAARDRVTLVVLMENDVIAELVLEQPRILCPHVSLRRLVAGKRPLRRKLPTRRVVTQRLGTAKAERAVSGAQERT